MQNSKAKVLGAPKIFLFFIFASCITAVDLECNSSAAHITVLQNKAVLLTFLQFFCFGKFDLPVATGFLLKAVSNLPVN